VSFSQAVKIWLLLDRIRQNLIFREGTGNDFKKLQKFNPKLSPKPNSNHRLKVNLSGSFTKIAKSLVYLFVASLLSKNQILKDTI